MLPVEWDNNVGHRLLGRFNRSDRSRQRKILGGCRRLSGVALARDALALVRANAIASASDPFSVGKAMTSSFRLDWRRDYIPINAGFSLNEHHEIEPVGYPLVELLAAIGLSNARPTRPAQHDKLQYLYAVMGRSTPAKSWIPLPLLRAAVGGSQLPFPTRRFRMFLGWPGKEGHARAITTVRRPLNDCIERRHCEQLA